MENGKLDMFAHRIRNEKELKEITEAISRYRKTKNSTYIKKYLEGCEEILEDIENDMFSNSLLAVILYDQLHPLTDKDAQRWRKHMLQRIKLLQIR